VPTRIAPRARRALRRLAGRPPGHAIASAANPADPETLPEFRFFAVLGTWMEEDVVEATVRNAFAQGVEAVYLVDNASTDATVERAVGAGAMLAESFDTDVYEEHVRILLMNAVVARVSLASGARHAWWLWLDADEFPEGPDAMTIRDYLATLDRRFRIVGSSYFNHFPTEKPEYLPGFHPADLQPMSEFFVKDRPRFCPQPHWKHPLQRFDRSGPFVMSIIGFHGANTLAAGPILEPEGGIVTHHAQYRDEAFTRARLELLCGEQRNHYNDSIGNTEIQKRFESLDAVYAQRWSDVADLRTRASGLGVHPTLQSTSGTGHRWYEPADLEAAKAQWKAANGAATSTASSDRATPAS
jgi:hypothetical protein